MQFVNTPLRRKPKKMNMIKRTLTRSLTDTSTIRSSSLSFLRTLSSTSVAAVADASDSSVEKVVTSTPSLLQPRVVLYDGVCHLCHQGIPILHSLFCSVLYCIVTMN